MLDVDDQEWLYEDGKVMTYMSVLWAATRPDRASDGHTLTLAEDVAAPLIEVIEDRKKDHAIEHQNAILLLNNKKLFVHLMAPEAKNKTKPALPSLALLRLATW